MQHEIEKEATQNWTGPVADAASSDPLTLQDALERYVAMIEVDGQVDRESFLAEFPQLADELRPHLDGIDLMLHMRPPVEPGPSAAPITADATLLPLATLGDYRLVREIGAGVWGWCSKPSSFPWAARLP